MDWERSGISAAKAACNCVQKFSLFVMVLSYEMVCSCGLPCLVVF